MRTLFFGDIRDLGDEGPEKPWIRVPPTVTIQEFAHTLRDLSGNPHGLLLVVLPLSEAKQELLLEFLSAYDGDVVLYSPKIDLSLRQSLADLCVCLWRGHKWDPDVTLKYVEKTLGTDCRHRRALGVWLKHFPHLRREDRLMAKAIDMLTVPTQARTAE